jgi:hypothetical protein
LDNSTTNKNKIRKNKSTPLVVLATFFDQHQSTATQINLNHSDTSDEDSIKTIELPIESSDECHEWYLDSCALTHFTNNKRYFKNYRQINNQTASTVTNDPFSIKRIKTIQLEILTPKEIKIRFQINNIYYSPKIRMNLLSSTKLFRQSEITDIWGDTAILSTRNGFKFCEIQYHEGLWKIKYLSLITSITYVPSEIVSLFTLTVRK